MRKYRDREIKRQRPGFHMSEMSSSEQLDATVHDLGNLAKETVQHKAAPRMLCMLMQTDFPHHDLGQGLIPHN